MKKFILFIAAAAMMGLFANCAMVQTAGVETLSGEKLATSGTSLGHVTSNNWGLYFLMFPLITGNDTQFGSVVFFNDNVTIPRQVDLVTAKVKEMGGSSATNMTSSKASNGFLFYINDVNVSANAIK